MAHVKKIGVVGNAGKKLKILEKTLIKMDSRKNVRKNENIREKTLIFWKHIQIWKDANIQKNRTAKNVGKG